MHCATPIRPHAEFSSATTSIAKGNKVMLPILAANRSKEIWGEDALEFKYVLRSRSYAICLFVPMR